MSTFISEFLLGGNGKRVAIKDSIDIAGHPTRSGSRAFADAPAATKNAEVVDAIIDAGWQIVGKTNLHEIKSRHTVVEFIRYFGKYGEIKN